MALCKCEAEGDLLRYSVDHSTTTSDIIFFKEYKIILLIFNTEIFSRLLHVVSNAQDKKSCPVINMLHDQLKWQLGSIRTTLLLSLCAPQYYNKQEPMLCRIVIGFHHFQFILGHKSFCFSSYDALI